MIIKIPGRGAVTIYSDTNTYISIPGDGPVEVVSASAASGGGPAVGDGLLIAAGGDYIIIDGGDYILLS